MKNRRNIVELKYPPENPNDIWLKDGKFYRSTSEGWVAIGSEIEYTNKESMIADKPEGGTIGIDKETGETSIYNDVAEQWSPLSGGGVTSITWLELKDKRDNGQLIPGSLYRITDYQCTTTQENTRSAGHQFDIVLLALSENKLAEEGWAMMHDNIYDVTFDDGVTKKCYVYDSGNGIYIVDAETLLGSRSPIADDEIEINEETKTAVTDAFKSYALNTADKPYNYFQNSNLSAWKVWYCLDNDKSRFAWADEENGKGVIYHLIDEFNNDIKYDFKNIQYQLRLDNNVYVDGSVGDYTWVYTFDALNLDTNERTDATLIDRTILIDDGYNKISNNFIGAFENYNSITELPNICFLLSWNSDDTYFGVLGNIFNNSKECYFSKELSDVLLIGCYFGSQSGLVQSSTFYVNNKKVLTES